MSSLGKVMKSKMMVMTMTSRRVRGMTMMRTMRTTAGMMTTTTMCILLAGLCQFGLRTIMMRMMMSTRKVKVMLAVTAIATMMRTRMMRTTICMRFCSHLTGLRHDENNDVNEEGDSDEDRMRMRKRKRGTMKKSKRSKRMAMTTTTMNTTVGANTMARTMMATRTTMRRKFCSRLGGIHKFILWTTMKRRRKARAKCELTTTTRKRTRSMMKKPKRR
ncbi:uncharacterized protein LOC120286414 [Eucalyptus grandis]|uniref:uncharacterized protein LOC120286414 n=1 Tax=Eucalyptus grandis TaxID=71139 RepID=UPI00192E92E0|nr:uncharacterized protein LOC120286414 [Eucalyptus grandis]